VLVGSVAESAGNRKSVSNAGVIEDLGQNEGTIIFSFCPPGA